MGLYVLGNKGVEYLKGLGYSVSSSYRPSKEIGQSYLHLLHQLGVNDILISAALLKASVAGYNLADFKVERELADKPFNAIWNGKSYGLIPDGFLDFRQALTDGHQLQTPVLYEFDRGTEQEEIIRRKVHAYATMLGSGWYKTRFGVNSIAVCFITFEGEKRRDKLREWARSNYTMKIDRLLEVFYSPQLFNRLFRRIYGWLAASIRHIWKISR